jgi:hypothetical protein
MPAHGWYSRGVDDGHGRSAALGEGNPAETTRQSVGMTPQFLVRWCAIEEVPASTFDFVEANGFEWLPPERSGGHLV